MPEPEPWFVSSLRVLVRVFTNQHVQNYIHIKQRVQYKNLGLIPYQQAWDLQEKLLQQNVQTKTQAREALNHHTLTLIPTQHHLLFCEHPPVYTLGKSGKQEHILINDIEREKKNIQFVKTNRGGDITFHGPEQLVVYPIFDLEKFDTDIGHYLRNLEEVVIQTLAHFNIHAERSTGETGVWIDAQQKSKARKICAIGIRCSRWITMHGLALNVNTDLEYFNYIIPCGIAHKQVTSMQKELEKNIPLQEVMHIMQIKFEEIFHIKLYMLNEPLYHGTA